MKYTVNEADINIAVDLFLFVMAIVFFTVFRPWRRGWDSKKEQARRQADVAKQIEDGEHDKPRRATGM